LSTMICMCFLPYYSMVCTHTNISATKRRSGDNNSWTSAHGTS
jgi:cytochrome c oxidase assembly protein Cox11